MRASDFQLAMSARASFETHDHTVGKRWKLTGARVFEPIQLKAEGAFRAR